ncbi:MAG: GNAT family N-acetyltransferase [Anaerolineales bacterium]|nr:GNAT family N-acetyltransferase [Anaerolineales bacterium]
MNSLIIKSVETTEDRKAFLSFPWTVYKDDPYWVPPIFSERMHFTDPEKNPFFQHSEVQFYMALRGERIAGTIAVFTNHLHNEYQSENVAFFGFFEVLEDYEAAELLFKTAEAWAKERGHTALRGPAQWSTNDECGLLVDGFDDNPRILMTYNPSYYVDYIEKSGYKYARDLWAYKLGVKKFMEITGERLDKLTTRILARKNITIHNLDMKKYDDEVNKLKLLYNNAWSMNWGFIPMTDLEFDQLADELHSIIDPDLVFIAEKDGKPVGFSLTLPDLNKPLRLAYPKPNTPEWWTMGKLVWQWKIRRKVSWIRVFALGVIPEYRNLGIDALFYFKTAQAALKKGIKMAEMSWILDNNDLMNKPIIAMGGEVYKTYRYYEKDL